MKTKKPPKVIQAVFHDHDGNDIAHDYYLNASWIAELCQRRGDKLISPYVLKAIESKRRLCVERYGTEWGREVVNPHPEASPRKAKKKKAILP